MIAALLNELKGVIGEGGLLYRRSDFLAYGYDASQGKGMPALIAIPDRSEQVAEIVKIANRYRIPFTARGAGTGLSGGSVPVSGGIVILLTRMNRILELDQENMVLVVEPGVVNLDIQNYLAPHGLYYPPDPASQRVSTIGGNLGENASGPHCLKYGGTLHYVTGIEVVLPEGDIINIGGRSPDPRLNGLLSLFIGSEGTLGIATKITLRVIRKPETTKTMLSIFKDIEDAVTAVSSIIAHGMIPSVLEAMDRRVIEAVESSIHAGYPDGAGAVLLIEVDGLADSLDRQIKKISEICSINGAYHIRMAISEDEKERLWEGRRGAFASLAKCRPSILIEDGTVPRSKLPQAMKKILEIGDRYRLDVGHVFHAGDGNFHPMILFDERDEEEKKRVRQAGEEMLSAFISFDGTISGEHGVGTEKISSMPYQFDQDTLFFFKMIKELLDPQNLSNPGKLLPEIEATHCTSSRLPTDLDAIKSKDIGDPSFDLPEDWGRPEVILEPSETKEIQEIISTLSNENIPFVVMGMGSMMPPFEPPEHRYAIVSLARLNDIVEYDPADMIVTVESGIALSALQACLRSSGQFLPLDPAYHRSVGGIVAADAYGPRAVSYGPVKDILLGTKVVTASGGIISCGGRLVKNVAGYDVAKLFVGSYGRLGIITEVTFRVYPIPEASKTILLGSKDLEPVLAIVKDIPRMIAKPGRSALLNKISANRIMGQDLYTLAICLEGYKEDVERAMMDLNHIVENHNLSGIEIKYDQEGLIFGKIEERSIPPSISLKVRIDPARSWSFIRRIENGRRGVGAISYPSLGLVEIQIMDTEEPDSGRLLEMIYEAALNDESRITFERMPTNLAKSLIKNHPRDCGYDIMEKIRNSLDPKGILNQGIIMGW